LFVLSVRDKGPHGWEGDRDRTCAGATSHGTLGVFFEFHREGADVLAKMSPDLWQRHNTIFVVISFSFEGFDQDVGEDAVSDLIALDAVLVLHGGRDGHASLAKLCRVDALVKSFLGHPDTARARPCESTVACIDK